MSFTPSASLIWGIPVTAYDDDGNPTPFWDPHRYCEPDDPSCSLYDENPDEYYSGDHEGDWRQFEGELIVVPYGHYLDDEQKGILSSTRMEVHRGDAWEPQAISEYDLPGMSTHDKAYSKSSDQARVQDLGVNFYEQAGWWLVASYG